MGKAEEMDEESENDALNQLYEETNYWHINKGDEQIYAKRIPGKFRNIKWATASLYLFYFLGPYMRWDGEQAILFDIPGRKYHIFGLTIWPQDMWMLALVLLTFFLLLYATTTFAGRVFCGYFCWQTIWVDIYTWIEEKVEGPPHIRKALDNAPWTAKKIAIKSGKNSVFLFLSWLTGFTFTAYFIDVYDLWSRTIALEGPIYIWTVPLTFLIGSYIGVAILREQICFWMCPYARIQGVMSDPETIMPTYDYKRGEKRARLKKGDPAPDTGDCVDCHLCVAVCPVGIDIRHGQQEGCITCGLCIDACDTIMDKVKRPKGLIRYMSLDELIGKPPIPLFKRGRMWVYSTLILLSFAGITYGLANMGAMKLTVIHERQPLYTQLSDGSIQNKYTLKIVNKTDGEMTLKIYIKGIDNAILSTRPKVITAPSGKVLAVQAFVKVKPENLSDEHEPIIFYVENNANEEMKSRYKSTFIAH